MNVFQYIEFEQPLNVKMGEKLLYGVDINQIQHVRENGTTVFYNRVYSESKRTYVYREVYANAPRPHLKQP